MKQRNLSCALLVLLVVLGVTPAAADDEPSPRIVVTGQGVSNIKPDIAVLQLTVVRENETASAALAANSSAVAEVLAAMRAQGVAERDLQTANFNIQPRYEQQPRPSSGVRPAARVVAYVVRNSLAVRVRDIKRVGEFLDTAVTLGVNEGGNILFTNDDPSAVITEARKHAVADAMQKAKTLAEAAGVELGGILEISEQSRRPRPMPMMDAEMAGMSRAKSAVPIAAGENSYSVNVSLTMAIKW